MKAESLLINDFGMGFKLENEFSISIKKNTQ